ncbi:MAG: hypothetical protein Q9219_003549 [cf. Caloplaca sp. 3 TL-2023]
MGFTRVAAVTGANKGIGLAIVRNLALHYPSSSFNNGSFLIYLTARDQTRGEEAVKALHNDAQLKQAKALANDGGLTSIKYHPLDISRSDSITDFAAFLKEEHLDGIDMLINNAGIAMQGFDQNVVQQTLQCNYYGTLQATQSILPSIRAGGRLINVSSMSGHLSSKYSATNRSAFTSAVSVDDITRLMQAFSSAVKQGKEQEQGWPSAAYAVSKCGIIGMTRAVALQQQQQGSTVLVNSCCPGFVSTDMTKGRGAKTVDQGAQTPVLLALGDIGGSHGEFWQHEKIIQW